MHQSQSWVLLLLAAGWGAPQGLPSMQGPAGPALCGLVPGLASAISLLDTGTSVQDAAQVLQHRELFRSSSQAGRVPC